MRRPQAGRLSLGGGLSALLLATGALGGPRLMDGHAALLWTRYHAAAGTKALRPAEHARQTARWAVRALDLTAPLPLGAEAARLALDLGRDIEARHPPAAYALGLEVRVALERLSASSLRGLGLGELRREAQGLETSARARLAASAARP